MLDYSTIVRIHEVMSKRSGGSNPPSAHFVSLIEIKVSDSPAESNGFPKYLEMMFFSR